jgi:tetrapyrrole methylase family protein/MazG family protein
MSKKSGNIQRLLKIMARLRGPGGCPWDIEQTHQSIRHNLIEECYEALEALDAGDVEAFKEELGDILLQVVFHAQMASEAGKFNFDDVAGAISDKLVRRHPHVFGKARADTSREVLRQWEAIKKTEKTGKDDRATQKSILHGVPKHLPALLKADKIQRKAARVGFDWAKVEDVVAKIEEELSEVKTELAKGKRGNFEEELGDLLFAVVNLARFKDVQAEQLLDRCVAKFVKRFHFIEAEVHRRGKRLDQCSLRELDAIWEMAKKPKRQTRRDRREARVRSL